MLAELTLCRSFLSSFPGAAECVFPAFPFALPGPSPVKTYLGHSCPYAENNMCFLTVPSENFFFLVSGV